MTANTVTLDGNEAVRIHDKLTELEQLRFNLTEARDKIFRLEMCLSVLLPIADQSSNDSDQRACAFIRTALGLPPKRGTPTLTVVGEAS